MLKMPTPARSKIIKEKVRRLPRRPGVYLMKDRFGGIIYVGKAKDLKKRVSGYFQPSRRRLSSQPKLAAMLGMIHDFETAEVKNETEALLLEGKLIKEWRPKFNTDFADDKRFPLVRVDVESEMPLFQLARFKKTENARYFGPFPHSKALRQTLIQMRLRFGILLGDARPARLPDGSWRLYDDARAEIYNHPNIVTVEEYRQRIARACDFLEGKSREWLAEINQKMRRAAQKKDFEAAATLRDLAFALEETLRKTRKFARGPLPRPQPAEALAELRHALALPRLPRRIECFDISHISGTFCAASMVLFTDGKPAKSQYRRYKIKSFTGNDDCRAMEEVVSRRYRRLRDEGREFPDLVLIDGGLGQVNTALRAFRSQNIEPPPLAGLAKKREQAVLPSGRAAPRLRRDSEALKLLQRVRDEAHRFARAYNIDLRRRRIRETVLDDFPGLGPARRRDLLDHFKSMKNMRKASHEQLRKVPGIGPKTAARLRAFLAGGNPGTRPLKKHSAADLPCQTL